MSCRGMSECLKEVPVRAWFATLSLGAAGLVSIGVGMQLFLPLSPCPLCIFQRLLYMVIAVLALGGVLLPVARLVWCALIGLAAVGGAATAGYQTWMQAFPELATECGFSEPNAIERLVDWLGMQQPTLFMATGFCSSRDWVFLNLSMANWSLLIFAAMAGFAYWLATRRD